MRDKVIILLIIYFAILAVFKERESLGCRHDNVLDFLSGTPPCDNSNNQYSRLIREEKPENPFEIFNRIVMWRRSFILSLIVITVYHFNMKYDFDGIKFLSSVIVGTFFIYFSFSFYKYHLDDYIYKEIMTSYKL